MIKTPNLSFFCRNFMNLQRDILKIRIIYCKIYVIGNCIVMRLLDVPSSYCGATKIFMKWHKNTTNYRNIKKVNFQFTNFIIAKFEIFYGDFFLLILYGYRYLSNGRHQTIPKKKKKIKNGIKSYKQWNSNRYSNRTHNELHLQLKICIMHTRIIDLRWPKSRIPRDNHTDADRNADKEPTVIPRLELPQKRQGKSFSVKLVYKSKLQPIVA